MGKRVNVPQDSTPELLERGYAHTPTAGSQPIGVRDKMTAHFATVADQSEPVVAAQVFPVQRRQGYYRNGFKRVLDVTLILMAAPLVVPLVVVMAMLIARDGHSPFYRQERVGRFGRVFKILKLRTMVHDADLQLATHLAHNAEARAEWQRTQKLKSDPRITKIGRILRKTSLDELPQLWNVLIGDMSLVGPRPMMCNQQKLYPGAAYYSVRPGITGLWQISARNNCEFSGRARFDTKYAEQMSFTTDLAILYRTVSVVARGTGY